MLMILGAAVAGFCGLLAAPPAGAPKPAAPSVLDLPRLAPGSPEYAASLAAANATRVAPAPVRGRVASVGETNILWAQQGGVFLSLHAFGAHNASTPITTEKSGAGDLLRQWQGEGTAAGLNGVLYDNLDRGHSALDMARFPQLTGVEYDAALRQRGYEYGFARLLLHGVPTLGNSSTAHTQGPFWRSQSRFGLANPRLVAGLFQQYINNHLYFYPEHRDHDADGHGDVFHANTPYLITSQGSSGSDQAFLQAFAQILAAFTPETRRALVEKKWLMPTAQMVFRMGRKPVAKPGDYFTGKAHPPVFAADSLDVERMVRLAHRLRPQDIAPPVFLRVLEEDAAQPGMDYFEPFEAERVFDTPCAVARVARATRWQRRMVVGAQTADGRPATFTWHLLQGDPARVRIRPLDEQGAKAEILIDWHDRRPVEPGGALHTCRVDIGVFTSAGEHPSPPSFISWLFPGNERRVYDKARQLQSVQYLPQDQKEHYVDPSLVTPVVWKDDYRRDEQGRVFGWTRVRGAVREEFSRHGALVLRRDAQGRPIEAQSVQYVRKQSAPGAMPTLTQEPLPEILAYTYRDPKDLLGEVTKRPAPKVAGPK